MGSLVNVLISAVAGMVMGVISFVVVKNIVEAQTTTSWTGAEIATVTIIPTIVALLTIVGAFMLLGKIAA